jgi:hypothetical protein
MVVGIEMERWLKRNLNAKMVKKKLEVKIQRWLKRN